MRGGGDRDREIESREGREQRGRGGSEWRKGREWREARREERRDGGRREELSHYPIKSAAKSNT